MLPNKFTKQQWRTSVEGIYTAVMGMFICSIVAGIVSFFSVMVPFLSIASIIIAIISAYFMFNYYSNLGEWKMRIPDQKDAKCIGYFRFYALFQLISACIGIVLVGATIVSYMIFPTAIAIFNIIINILTIANFIVAIFIFIGFILETVAAASLRKSSTMHHKVREGMNRIYKSNMLLIIGIPSFAIISLIVYCTATSPRPIFAWFMAAVLLALIIAIIVLRLTGWKRVSESDYLEEPTNDDSTTQLTA